MSWIPAPLVPTDDDRIPITVWLPPTHAARLEILLVEQRGLDPTLDEHAFIDTLFSRGLTAAEQERHGPTPSMRTTMQENAFITVPETTLPDGSTVPSFEVGQYVCSQSEDGKLTVTAEGTPWTRVNHQAAIEACRAAGFALLTERQWLAIAHNAAALACNWNTGIVGKGRLFQGLRNDSVTGAQPGTFEPEDPDEQRWLTLTNGARICDLNGNVFQRIFDDVQGDAEGIVARPFAADSPSLHAPFPSLEKGMGWRPEPGEDWSGYALIRGGGWSSGRGAGAFYLYDDWPGNEWGTVGFRCTR